MKPRLLFALFVCLLATALFTVGCGGSGGGDDSITTPTGSNNPGTYEGTTSGNGVATGYVSSAAISPTIRMSMKSSVSNPASGLSIQAGDYNEEGVFVPFGLATTTDPNGFYRLEGLPTGRKNIVLRISDLLEGILPEIEEGKIASAPIIDPNSKYQAKLVKFAEKFDATFEVNLGEILSMIPASQLPTNDADLEKIAQAFVNREQAQLQTFRAAGLADAKFIEFRNFAFSLQQKINAGIAEGLYSAEEGWKLFDDQLRLLAQTLGLAPDVQIALQDIDSTMVDNSLPQGIIDTGIRQQLEYQHIIAKLEGLLAALKVLTPTYLPLADYEQIADGVERIAAALKTAPNADAVEMILRSDSLHGMIQATFKTIFSNLKLMEGEPPLITRLYPNPTDMQLIKTTAGYAPADLGDMTVSTSVRAQTLTAPPTPTQLTTYHDALKDLIIGKIRLLLPALTPDQATALFVLLMQGPEMGFTYIPNDIPATGVPGELPSQIMGIIVTSNNSLYIQPPAGYPEGPQEFSGFLAMVDPNSTINSVAVTATTTPHVYAGVYTAKPSASTPPTFKITGIINDTVTIPELGKMTFTGGPLEQDTNGQFWFGLGRTVATKFVPTSDMVANSMQNLLGRMVQIEGIITAKRPAPDYGPAIVEVYAIMPASTSGYTPPGVELPTAPVYGTVLENQSGLWSFSKTADSPMNMFKFTWTVNNVATSAYVDFDPNTLDKYPQFRFQNQVSGRDMWESNGHTVTVTGKSFFTPEGVQRLFITNFVDATTVWPDPEVPFTPPSAPASGTLVTDLLGTWVFTPENATQPFEFTWMDNGTHIAFVEFDMASLVKSPVFRYQDKINGHDMWESHLHQVTVSGMLSADGKHLFLTEFNDASTEWPKIEVPGETGIKLRGQLNLFQAPTMFVVNPLEISTGTVWVPFKAPPNAVQNVIIENVSDVQNTLINMYGDGTRSGYAVELTGTWGQPTPDTEDPAKMRLHFIPSAAREVTLRWDSSTSKWIFGN